MFIFVIYVEFLMKGCYFIMVYFYLLVERIFCLSSLLEKGFYECSYVICLCLLVVLSGESVFFFGLSGIVKSLIVWCLKFVF